MPVALRAWTNVRQLVAYLAILILLVGLMEILFPTEFIWLTQALANRLALRIVGVFGLLVGAVLLFACARRLVGLRTFVLILGLYVIAGGTLALVSPGIVRDLMYWLVLDRKPGFQLAVLWASGLVRIAIGAALLYAWARRPRTA